MLSPIPKARYSPSSSRPPMSRIITVRCHCCGPSDECSPNCATSSPIASIADQSCWTQSPSWAGGRSRSSPDPRPSGPSSQSLDDGWSNAPSLGSDATVALPRISRQASPAPRRGSWWQASACSLAASQGLEMTGIILSQTLGRTLAWVGSAAGARTLADASDYARGPVSARRCCRLRGSPPSRPFVPNVGQKVVIENKGGAGGGIGHAVVARAEPDGYTIMTALPSLAVIPEGNRLQGKPVPYEMDQFVPLARMLADPPILAVRNASPWNSLDEFIAAVRASPARIPYGTSGHLGTVHLAMEMFLNAAQLKMVHVPYQGGGPSFNALLSDQVPVVPTLESTAKGQIDAGNIRILAQWGTERLPSFPHAPTLSGGRISGGRLYPLDRGVCAEEYAGARDGLSARRDPPVYAGSSRHRAFRKSWKPGFLS